ncbi:MAG TPA: DUF2330 domain-containing protein [Gemmataceae bacterium]|nr:DUF2330 domain-containing protein [Gemmataceae bacterium]
MRPTENRQLLLPILVGALAIAGIAPQGIHAACCYFSAKDADILQPAQKVFITWDPVKGEESFTVQPKFEGNARDFGMVIPTPSQPKLHAMPRDFFKHLAVFSILKKREQAHSKLLPMPPPAPAAGFFSGRFALMNGVDPQSKPRESTVKVLETGVVGSLDYKIIEAGRADDLYAWLKANKYSYSGDEATLNFYVQKKWVFTVMKIDTMQMRKNKDGSYAGEVSPTRFTFQTDKLVYPLKITQISVKDKTEALFYVQAPYKVDLPGEMSYQYQWVPMLQAASGCTPGGLPGKGADWLKALDDQLPALLKRGQDLGFGFVQGRRPVPNQQGRVATTMEWARRLSADDIKILTGKAPYGEKVPDVDEGFTQADLKDPQRAAAIFKVIQQRLAKARQERPDGYLVREAPLEDVRALQHLAGHLQAGLFITKFRKIFTRGEMNDDLLIIPARQGQREDNSEYEEILPTSPP